MLMYVDESGCTGLKIGLGSSSHFVVAGLVFETTEKANACSDAIQRLRESTGLVGRREFRFSTCNNELRMRFLECLAGCDFRYWAFALNKGQLVSGAMRKPGQMYSSVLGWIFQNAGLQLRDVTVTYDATGGREFRQALTRHLRELRNSREQQPLIKAVTPGKSHSINCLQVADMVAGAINRGFKTDCPDREMYRQAIVKREAQLRIWP